jgi:hypothetical protein
MDTDLWQLMHDNLTLTIFYIDKVNLTLSPYSGLSRDAYDITNAFKATYRIYNSKATVIVNACVIVLSRTIHSNNT